MLPQDLGNIVSRSTLISYYDYHFLLLSWFINQTVNFCVKSSSEFQNLDYRYENPSRTQSHQCSKYDFLRSSCFAISQKRENLKDEFDVILQ